MVVSFFTKAISLSLPPQSGQTISPPKVRRSSSCQGMDRLRAPTLGAISAFAEAGWGTAAAGTASGSGSSLGPGTTWLRHRLCEESTPKYTVTCRRGGGTMADSRVSKAFGSKAMLHVPSFQGLLNSKARFAPGHAPVLH